MDHTVETMGAAALADGPRTTAGTRATEPGRPAGPRDRGSLAVVSLIWVAAAFVGGLFVVDAIGALETEPDECFAYAYGGGPNGDGCNPLLGDAYFEVSQTDDLVDRQRVTVKGFLFDPFSSVGIVQCSGVAFTIPEEPSGVTACDLSNVALTSTNASGEFETTLLMRRLITTPDAGLVDCAAPNSNCVIAGGVLGADQMSTTEAAYASITFDPDAPPIPPPSVSVELVEIGATDAVIVVECENATQLSVDVQLSQVRNDRYGYAYGGIYEFGDNGDIGESAGLACNAEATEYEIELRSGDRRIGRGDVDYYVSAWVYDGFESDGTTLEGSFTLRRTPRIEYIEEAAPGESVEIVDVEVVGRGDDQRVRATISCERAAQYASVSINVSQWAGLDRIQAYGSAPVTDCPTETTVDIPITPYNGRLQSGDAQLDVSIYVQDNTIGGYYFDRASLSEKVRLRGRAAAPVQSIDENPESRITIEKVTRSGITGTVECDEPVMVELQANAQQYRGRVLWGTYGYLSDYQPIDCDGTVSFSLDWREPLRRGTTGIGVYANGYNLLDEWPDGPDYPDVTTTTASPTTTIVVDVTDDGDADDDDAADPPRTFAEAAAAQSAAVAEGAPAGAPVPPVGPPAGAVDGMPLNEGAIAGGYYQYVWSDSQGATVRVRR